MADRRQTFVDQLYIHFVTFSVFKRRRLLDLDAPKKIVLEMLCHQLQAMSAKCLGYVLMPDHVHALLWVPEAGQLRRFLHGWKRMSSFAIRRWYAEYAPNYFSGFGAGEHFWQTKNDTFEIETERKLLEKLEYMHLNPVRAGLVKTATDWRWSSARWYVEEVEVDVPISWIDL